MSDEMDIQLTEGIPDDPRLAMIDSQLILISSLWEVDMSQLYDEWNEQKIKVVSAAMRIILKNQKAILSEKNP